MTHGRTLGFLALAALLGLAGCQRWCERNYPPPAYGGGCCAPATQQPCCAPVSNYPVQPCAPASNAGWGPAPLHQ